MDLTSILSGTQWDRNAVRNYFIARAENDKLYLTELKSKLPSRSAYQAIYDQTLASYYVHNYCRGRSWLSSREEFLQALAELEISTMPVDDYFDKERFATFRLNLIRSLLRAASITQ